MSTHKFLRLPGGKSTRQDYGRSARRYTLLLLAFFIVLGEGFDHGLHGPAGQLVAALGVVVERAHARAVGAIDDWQHVTREQFVRMLGAIELRPVVREQQ